MGKKWVRTLSICLRDEDGRLLTERPLMVDLESGKGVDQETRIKWTRDAIKKSMQQILSAIEDVLVADYTEKADSDEVSCN